MSEGAPARGVVLGHGKMAEGMVDAVRRITGSGEDVLVGLSNEGCSSEGLAERIDRLMGDGPTVVFTDLSTGSCALSAHLACRTRNRSRAVIFGTNLPMLLDFVFHRDLPLDELVGRLLEKGRAGVGSLGEEP